MKRLLWIVGLPLFLAACSGVGGLYGSAPAASPTASAPAASASASAGTPAPTAAAPANVLATQNAGLGTILANPQGRTLYYFVPERGGRIVCSSSACIGYWPPSITGGTPSGGAGVTGQLGLIARSGAQQITYNTWPLYTFSGDSAAGQTNGQGVVAFGGKWLVATPGLQP